MDKNGSERVTKTWGSDLISIRMGQKEPLRPAGAIYYGYEWARTVAKIRGYDLLRTRVDQKESPKSGGTNKSGPERATKTRGYDLLRIIKSPVIRKKGSERATKTPGYDLLWMKVNQNRGYESFRIRLD